MLSIDVLNNKPVIRVNGQDIVDMTASSIGVSGRLRFVSAIYNPQDFEMRPDLLSRLYLGDHNKMGMLLKINGISNPFSIEGGDIFLIPSIDSVESLLAVPQSSTGAVSERTDFRKKLTERISKMSSSRKEYLESRATAKSTPLPPNVTAEGEQQVEIKDGKMILGTNIGVSANRGSIETNRAGISARNTNRNLFNL